MGIYTVRKEFTFDACHRLLYHSGKCKYLHGHTYRVVVELQSQLLASGMVVDFGIIKDRIGMYLNTTFDHNTILNNKDPLFLLSRQSELLMEDKTGKVRDTVGTDNLRDMMTCGRPWVGMDVEPTAENIAKKIHDESVAMLADVARGGVVVTRVTVWETQGACGEYTA